MNSSNDMPLNTTTDRFDNELKRITDEFLTHELPPVSTSEYHGIEIAAVGTIAQKVLSSQRLQMRIEAAGTTISSQEQFGDCTALFASPNWDLALIFSPYKMSVLDMCDKAAPSATSTRVADTVIRNNGETLALNTNTYAAGAAIRHLIGWSDTWRVLLAGTGASARSVMQALSQILPEAEIGILGRSPQKVEQLIADMGFGVPASRTGSFRPDLFINATTVGEMSDDPEDFNILSWTAVGSRFFDLNSHTNMLQSLALAHGCTVMSGTYMQEITNALRAAMVSHQLSL